MVSNLHQFTNVDDVKDGWSWSIIDDQPMLAWWFVDWHTGSAAPLPGFSRIKQPVRRYPDDATGASATGPATTETDESAGTHSRGARTRREPA